MSKSLATGLARLVKAATVPMRPYRRMNTLARVAELLVPTVDVAVDGSHLAFYSPSARSLHDTGRFYENEPDTIRWLNTLSAEDVLWDIGANIGAFALYAAKARDCRVVAFEPSAASHAVLTRNIELNGLDDKIAAYCMAFDAETKLDALSMANTEAGHSMHAFGQEETIEGRIAVRFRQAVLGFAVDDFLRRFQPPPPSHVKLDVDSIEPRILRGAAETLRRHVREVLVEIDGSHADEIRGVLREAGFAERMAPKAGNGDKDAARNSLFVKR